MNFFDKLKTLLRPGYYAFRKALNIKSEHERRQSILEDSFSVLSSLSQQTDISSLTFKAGQCIIKLKDERVFFFDPYDRVARMYSVPHTGTFEKKETLFVSKFLKPGQVCIDAGANFGWYSILFSRLVGPDGHVYSFEPVPHTLEILERNVKLNECRNIVLNNIALDEKNRSRELFLPDIGVSGSFKLHNFDKDFESINCKCQKLDDYCDTNNIRRVDFIKADIEGAEFALLKGAKEILTRNHPTLLLEIQSHSSTLFGYQPADIFKWLIDLGYAPYIVNESGDLTTFQDYESKLPDNNFVFLQKERNIQ